MNDADQHDGRTGLDLSFDWTPIRSRSGQNQTELALSMRYRLEPFWLNDMALALREIAEHTMNHLVTRTMLKQEA